MRRGRPFLQWLQCSRQVWVGIDGGLSKMSDRLLTSTAAANQTTTTGLRGMAVIAIHGGNVAFASTEQAGQRRRAGDIA